LNIVYPFSENEGVFRPEIPIAISNVNNAKAIITNAIMDSGADVTLIPAVILKFLSIDFKKDAESSSKVIGVSGEVEHVWIHTLDFLILKENSNVPFHRVTKLKVHVIDSRDAVILLGTNFFLNRFRVTLDYINKLTLLET